MGAAGIGSGLEDTLRQLLHAVKATCKLTMTDELLALTGSERGGGRIWVATKVDEHGSPCEGAWHGQSMAKDAVHELRTTSSATVLIGTRGVFVYMRCSVEGGGEKAG